MSNIDPCRGCKWVFAPEEQTYCWSCENQSGYEPWETKNAPKPTSNNAPDEADCDKAKSITNGDRIRMLNDESLSLFLFDAGYDAFDCAKRPYKTPHYPDSRDGWLAWLSQNFEGEGLWSD